MTSYTQAEAQDVMFGIVNEVWLAGTPEHNGGDALPIRWPAQEREPEPVDQAHARVFCSHTGGRQGSLSGADGLRRWNRTGMLTVQVRAPVADGQGLSLSQKLAKLVADAYEGRSIGSLWFRNVRLQEIGVPSGGQVDQRSNEWFQTNVYAEFSYDELK